MEKRRNCSYGAISPLFHNISNVSLILRVKLHIHFWNVFIRFIFILFIYLFIFFFSFCKSDMSRYGYLEVFKRVPWTEITRVDCICSSAPLLLMPPEERVSWTCHFLGVVTCIFMWCVVTVIVDALNNWPILTFLTKNITAS